jgi:hypothetical protein
MWSQTPSSRASRLDRAEPRAVAHQGVWHARGNRAIADDATIAVVRSHRLRRCVAPPALVRGATRCWEEIGAQIRCLSPFRIDTARR